MLFYQLELHRAAVTQLYINPVTDRAILQNKYIVTFGAGLLLVTSNHDHTVVLIFLPQG